MNPAKESIAKLLADGTTFYIPFYQRAYVWTEKLWSRFIRDMEYITQKDEEYFIGSVILKKMEPKGVETERWEIVDGQQRLTTLAIFYKVISLKNPTLHNPFDKRFRLENGELNIRHSYNDKDAYEKIANLTEDTRLEGEKTSNLIKAFNYFRDNIDVNKINHTHIQSRLWFISIYLEANENEHKIFDTINSIGMSLNTEELLKNYLFTSATLEEYKTIWRPVFEADGETITYWKEEISVGSTGKKSISDRFFHTLLQIIMHDPRNKISSADRAEFRKYDEENEFNNYQKVIKLGEWDKIEFAKEIVNYAKLFKGIYVRKNIQESSTSYTTPLNRLLLIVFTMDVNTAIPYILYVLKNVEEKFEQDRIFTLLESYIVRRMICNKASNNYSDLFTESLIGQQVLNCDTLIEYLRGKKAKDSLHMPYDVEVEEGFLNNCSLAAKKAKGILYLLESKLRESQQCETILHPFEKYTLEHIMPQEWDENWPVPESLNEIEKFEFVNRRKCKVQSLGNLAIISQGLNSKVSNEKWRNKLSKGLKDKAGDLITMKEVVTCIEWNEETITARSEWLAEQANFIWENVISIGEKEEVELKKHRASASNIRIIFPDGNEIINNEASISFVEFVKRIGTERVRKLNLSCRQVPLISDIINTKYQSSQKDVGDGLFLITKSSTLEKKQFIETISNKLDLGVKVEIVAR